MGEGNLGSGKAILVHNPTAGVREPDPKTLIKQIERIGFDVKCYSTKKPGLEAKLAKRADLVVAAGGDGTIAKVAKFLAAREEEPPPLAIIPLGTANNIAQSLGVRGDPDEIISRWSLERTCSLSCGRAKAHWGEQLFIEAVGMGPLARATSVKLKGKKTRAERIDEGRLAFRKALREAEPERLYVNIDGERIEEEILLLEVLNIRQVGPRLNLAPAADVGDDLLDVVYVPTGRRKKMIAWLDQLIADGGDAAVLPKPPVRSVRGRNVVIAWTGMELRIDDAFPLMPGQTAPRSPDKEPGAGNDRADLLDLQIAGRKLKVLAPGKPRRPSARKDRS